MKLNNTLVPNGSFESPTVTDYQVNPTNAVWNFSGSAGIAANGGTYTSHNPNAPGGNQVAFIENNGSLWLSWPTLPGTYTLSFQAAQRGSNNDSYQQLRVTMRPSPGPTSVKTFVWSGNTVAEERDSTGANVTKRFFAEGEKRIGGADAGNYYYTRDHLGSVREVSESSGTLKGQYDYDAWGNSVVTKGKMQFDFGYTGHYFHQPSRLNLAVYRPYHPNLGRWISRDPIGELAGINLYGYVLNDPIRVVDHLGLDRWVVTGMHPYIVYPDGSGGFVRGEFGPTGTSELPWADPSGNPNAIRVPSTPEQDQVLRDMIHQMATDPLHMSTAQPLGYDPFTFNCRHFTNRHMYDGMGRGPKWTDFIPIYPPVRP